MGIAKRTVVVASAGVVLVAVAGGGAAYASSRVDWAASTNVCHTATTYSDVYAGNAWVSMTMRGYHMQWYAQKSDPNRLWRVFTVPGEKTTNADGSPRALPEWWRDLTVMPSSVNAIQCGSDDQPDASGTAGS